jgi:hypothetical protein
MIGVDKGAHEVSEAAKAGETQPEEVEHLWLPKIVSGLAQMPRWAILSLGCLTS